MLRQISHRLKVPDRQKVVDVRKSRRHARRERRVGRSAEEWIEPNQSVTARSETAELEIERARVAGLPPVADDQYHRAPAEDAWREDAVERAEALADARASGEIDDLGGRAIDRLIDPTGSGFFSSQSHE